MRMFELYFTKNIYLHFHLNKQLLKMVSHIDLRISKWFVRYFGLSNAVLVHVLPQFWLLFQKLDELFSFQHWVTLSERERHKVLRRLFRDYPTHLLTSTIRGKSASTVVVHSTHNPAINGSNPVFARHQEKM